MPKLTDSQTRQPARILVVGDPGSGKTGMLAHLLDHDQKLFIADFDDKLTPIRQFVKPEKLGNLVYEKLIDQVRPDKITGYPTTVGKPTAFRRFINLVNNGWIDSGDGTNYGKPESWDDNTWLVIDNLTSLGRAALFYSQDIKGQLGQKTSLPTLGAAIERVEGVPMLLKSYPINTIMLAHLAHQSPGEELELPEGESKTQTPAGQPERKLSTADFKRYPYTLGRKLPRRIGAYFTAVLQTKTIGSGERAVRVIRTVPDEDVDVQVPTLPKALPAELPLTELYRVITALQAA